jgi:hypothetical protein
VPDGRLRQGDSLRISYRNHGHFRERCRRKPLSAAGYQLACRRPEKEFIAMANILVNIEKGIEIGAEDALKWLTGANKALKAAPQVVAALATLIAAVEKPIAELAGAAANPLNIALDIQTATDLKAAWPEVIAFLTSLGVKF